MDLNTIWEFVQMKRIERKTTSALRGAILILVLVMIVGVAGYVLIEDYTVIDALYMTVITVSTVGFGEVKELSEEGRLFTVFLIISSIGGLAYVGSIFVRFIFEGELVEYLKTYKVDKKILKLNDHVIICGYGRNGEQVAHELALHNKPFVIIERREDVISHIREHPDYLYVRGDATQEEVLGFAGIEKATALIATTPSDADNVFVVLTARSMNPNIQIVSRASYKGSDVKLKRAGADNIIMPEKMGGKRMAKLVMQPDVVEFVEYILLQNTHEVTLEKVSCKRISTEFLGRSVEYLRSHLTTGVTILGIRNGDGRYFYNPPVEYKVSSSDSLFVLGSKDQIDVFVAFLEQEMS